MFSGIIEALGTIQSSEERSDVVVFHVTRPHEFGDLRNGDSIAVNGVCLTVEDFDSETIRFALGPETLKVTNWRSRLQVGEKVNLERSLRFGDRVHGHFVTGHVDGLATVVEVQKLEQSEILKVRLNHPQHDLLWKKGTMAVNGVSLTINEVSRGEAQFCLIPKTLRRTNLGKLMVGDSVHVEYDYLAKALKTRGNDELHP